MVPLSAFFSAAASFVRSDPAGWERREVTLGLRNNTHVAIRVGRGAAGDVIGALHRPVANATGETIRPMASKDLKLKQRIGRPAWSGAEEGGVWIAGLGACLAARPGPPGTTPRPTPVDVAVARVRKGDFVIGIKARGEIRSTRIGNHRDAAGSRSAYRQAGGVGRPVKKGEVVIEFDAVQQEQNYLDKATGVRASTAKSCN